MTFTIADADIPAVRSALIAQGIALADRAAQALLDAHYSPIWGKGGELDGLVAQAIPLFRVSREMDGLSGALAEHEFWSRVGTATVAPDEQDKLYELASARREKLPA